MSPSKSSTKLIIVLRQISLGLLMSGKPALHVTEISCLYASTGQKGFVTLSIPILVFLLFCL